MRVLVIEDHPLVRESLKLVITGFCQNSVVFEASTAREAVPLLAKYRWDVILLDIELPDRSGLDLLRDVQNLAPNSPVLVFSGRCEEEFGRLVLKAGAAGFLPKASGADEVQIAIRRVVAGKKYVTTELASSLAVSGMMHGDGSLHYMLSPREMEVLRLYGTGCNTSGIAERLGVSVKTVSTYRTRIMEKLGLTNTASLIRYSMLHNLAG